MQLCETKNVPWGCLEVAAILCVRKTLQSNQGALLHLGITNL